MSPMSGGGASDTPNAEKFIDPEKDPHDDGDYDADYDGENDADNDAESGVSAVGDLHIDQLHNHDVCRYKNAFYFFVELFFFAPTSPKLDPHHDNNGVAAGYKLLLPNSGSFIEKATDVLGLFDIRAHDDDGVDYHKMMIIINAMNTNMYLPNL